MSDSSGCQPRLDAKQRCSPTKDGGGDASNARLAELIDLYQARVEQLAHRLLGWSGDADDVVQEVFMAVLQNMSRFKGLSSHWTWITRITVNACRQQQRRRAVRNKFRWFLAARPADCVRARDHLAELETHERLAGVVRALPVRLREVVVLRYLQEMPLGDAAAALGISSSVASNRLHRALVRLRELLGEDAL